MSEREKDKGITVYIPTKAKNAGEFVASIEGRSLGDVTSAAIRFYSNVIYGVGENTGSNSESSISRSSLLKLAAAAEGVSSEVIVGIIVDKYLEENLEGLLSSFRRYGSAVPRQNEVERGTQNV